MPAKTNNLVEPGSSKANKKPAGCYYLTASEKGDSLIKLDESGTQFIIYKTFKNLLKKVTIGALVGRNNIEKIGESIKAMKAEIEKIQGYAKEFTTKCQSADKAEIKRLISKHGAEALTLNEFLDQEVEVVDLHNKGRNVKSFSMKYRNFLSFDDAKVSNFVAKLKELQSSKDKREENFDDLVAEIQNSKSYFRIILEGQYSRATNVSSLFESAQSFIISEDNFKEGMKKRFMNKFGIEEFSQECIDSKQLNDGIDVAQGDHSITYESISRVINLSTETAKRAKIKVYKDYKGYNKETIRDSFGIVSENGEIYIFPKGANLDSEDKGKLEKVLNKFENYASKKDYFESNGDLDLEVCCPNAEDKKDIGLLKANGSVVNLNMQHFFKHNEVNSSIMR